MKINTNTLLGTALFFVAVILPVPLLATLVTVVLYIILAQQFNPLPGWLGWTSLLIGLVVTGIIWLVSAFYSTGRITAEHANKSSYDGIVQELGRLEVNFQLAQTTTEAKNDDSGALERANYALYGKANVKSIADILQENGTQWIQASGYTNIWNRLQTADEEMITVLPAKTLLGYADYDLARLEGSTIPHSQQWIATINEAKAILETLEHQNIAHPEDEAPEPPPAQAQVIPGQPEQKLEHQIIAHPEGKAPEPPSANEEQKLLGQAMLDLLKFDLTSSTVPLDDTNIPKSFGHAFLSLIKHTVASPSTTTETQQSGEQARQHLQQARSAINSYVSNRWAGLITSRNLQVGTAFYTSIFIYVLCVIAVIAEVPASSLVAALVFFIVGVAGGLFPRLLPKTTVTRQAAKAANQPARAKNLPAKTNGQSATNHPPAGAADRSKASDQSSDQSNTQDDASNVRPLTDDYGLTRARVLITPVLSGLAAIIGVVLASTLSITLVALTPGPSNTATPTPTAIVATATTTTSAPAAPQGNRSIPNYPSLNDIYSLSNNIQGVIFALVFGLLPGLVITFLQREAAAWQKQLQSADPGEQGSSQ